MRLSTFIAENIDIFNSSMMLKEDFNHIKNVLRLQVGDSLRTIDGEKEYFCCIQEFKNKSVILKILDYKENQIKSKDITAAISIIKSQNLCYIVKELTEIGIKNFIPLITKRSQYRDFNLDKFNKISIEATKQCGRVDFMNISKARELKDIDFNNYEKIITCYEKEKENNFWSILSEIKSNKILFIIGPEGGFEDQEVNYLKSKNSLIVSISKTILKSESASLLVGGALINGT